ncbi:MAG: FtsW/RodA/SpoVE family cell cycle protein [Clostridiaceae bacterium]|nr:FtsW/RodA/SpoVE family cell cycle protein [Clostridiaceae bacterium]
MGKILNYHRPIRMILLINIIAFTLLYLYKESYDYHTILFGLGVIGLINTAYFLLKWGSCGDEYLFLIVAMLVSIGIIMIYRLDKSLGIKQITWFVIGIVLFFLSYFVYQKFNFWDRLIYVYMGCSFILFLLTLLLGKNIQGATNWIVVKGQSIQPSEIIKIFFVFFIASYYKHPEKLKIPPIPVNGKKINIGSDIVLSAAAYMYMGFLVLQREWGSAVLFFIVYFTLLYVFENGKKILLINGILAVLGGIGGFLFVHHIKVRVDVWLNPWKDIAGTGYQITQSLFAIGSGGFFGRGIGLGSPKYIPEVQTDFIFSAICEEMGIFGGTAVVFLFFLLVYRGCKIAMEVENAFNKAVALGITIMFGFQTFIIIGGVIKLIPMTGITLPFVSYGGSSLTTSFIALGILQAISKKAYEVEEELTVAKE